MAGTSDSARIKFIALCKALREVKNGKDAATAVGHLQLFLNDDRSRQLIHRWRNWGYLFNCFLHVIKTEMRMYFDGRGRRKVKTSTRTKEPQLWYWQYLRTELETAHKTADGPFLHLDRNGRDCIRQLVTFSLATIDRPTRVGFDRRFETRVDKEAWLTVEVVVQYRVYCAVLDYKEWENIAEVALGSISAHCETGRFTGEKETATTRARLIHLLFKNCPFDLIPILPTVTMEIEAWLGAVKIEEDVDLLLVIASSLMDTLTDMMRANVGSIAPYMLKRGITVLKFIYMTNKQRKSGLRGAPAEFIMQFLELVQHATTTQTELCCLPSMKLLDEMKKLVHIALSPDELNLLLNSAKELRSGSALEIEDQDIRRVACIADIVFHHDHLVSQQSERSRNKLTQDNGLLDQFDVGNKRPRFTSTYLAWETVLEHFFDSLRADHPFSSGSSISSASQRQSPSIASLFRDPRTCQSKRSETKQINDPSCWLLLLLAILRRHGDYYMCNRIGDVMMVLQKLAYSLVVKEVGKLQLLTLQVLVQMALLSDRFYDECHEFLDEHWATVWHNLLRPELPYTRATQGIGLMRGQAGDAVLTLLNCCISLKFVSIDKIEASSIHLWNLPAFQHPPSDASVSRGDSMRPLARTSMASIVTLLSLLRHVQLPTAADTTSKVSHIDAIHRSDADMLQGERQSIQSKLLGSVFDHLRAQVFHRNLAPTIRSLPSTFTKIEWQTEVSSTIYASVIRAFLSHSTSTMDIQGTIFVPEVLRKFSARNENECENWIVGEEMNGFGVHFCMLEKGLETLSVAFPSSTGIHSAAFSPSIQVITGKLVGTDERSWDDSVGSLDRKLDDHFERLAVPTGLLRELLPRQNYFLGCEFVSSNDHATVQSISKDRLEASQSQTISFFTDLLSEIWSHLPSDGSSPQKGLQILANSMDVGLILATLCADENVIDADQSTEGCFRVLPLLTEFFQIITNYMTPSIMKQAQLSRVMTENTIHVLRKLHTLILILQGRTTLERCRHPSADPIDLRIPSALRPAIRGTVKTLEAWLSFLSDTSDTTITAPDELDAESDTEFAPPHYSPGKVSSRTLQAQVSCQSREKEWDAMDDCQNSNVARGRPASHILLKTASLWCFRLMLLLKKESGLSSVKKHFENLHFSPDFMLAVAVLLCGVPGQESLRMLIKLLDYAADEVMGEGCSLSTTGSKSCQSSIFLSQVLAVIALAGLVYEKRKDEMDESPPTILMECATKYLDIMGRLTSKSYLRMARRAELQCLEIFFRLDSCNFSVFEDACVTGLTDCDVSVRFTAARSLQSLYFMYPEGGGRIFRHIYKTLERLVAASIESSDHDSEGQTRGHECDPRMTMDSCLSVLLCLYVSACSSQIALPIVLQACVAIVSRNQSLYVSGTPSLLSTWLNPIALFYGYADVCSMVDDHFCNIWHAFLAEGRQLADSEEEHDVEWMKSDRVATLREDDWLQQLPLSVLCGNLFDVPALKSNLATKLDTMIPVSVLYCFITDEASGVKENRFAFIRQLLSYFSCDDLSIETDVGSSASEQLTTDLFALSFILMASPYSKLFDLATRMFEVAEERTALRTLSVSRLGHTVTRMTRFIVWDLVQGGENEQLNQGEVWKRALKVLQAKYVDFHWNVINLAEVLIDVYVLLLASKLFYPRAVCAVECLKHLAIESCDTVAQHPVLQHLLLLICFQALKHLAINTSRRIGGTLTCLVRTLCERFLKHADMFGTYLGFVIDEISEILFSCSGRPLKECPAMPRRLSLNADEQADLEWVIFAVCNELSSELGKYARNINRVVTGISSSLDKLDALLIRSRETFSSKTGPASSQGSLGQVEKAEQEILMFLEMERMRGPKFDNSLSLGRSSRVSTVETSHNYVQKAAEPLTGCVSDVNLSALATQVASVRGSSTLTRDLLGRLTRMLLYQSSSGTFGITECNQDRNLASLANVLGEIGALDASEYNLSLNQEKEQFSRLYRLHFHRGTLGETNTAFALTMHENVLRYLSSSIVEGRAIAPAMLEQILKTLKQILNLDEGGAALARCKDGELKAFLNLFEGSLPSDWSSALRSRSSESGPTMTRRRWIELWTCANQVKFETWVCSLTSSLTRIAPDEVLKACSTLASLRVDFAVFLFPYALESIFRKPELQQRTVSDDCTVDTSQIKEAITQGMNLVLTDREDDTTADPSRQHPPQVIQLIIHSINFLRETERARFVETNGRKKALRQMHGPRSQECTGLAYGCMVEVDLLALAKAATRVKMPYSAMQYVEMWLEKENGGKLVSLSSLKNDEVVTTLRSILVDACLFDSADGDDIYGVIDGRTVQSQLVKFNFEREYAKAIPLYDVSLQFVTSNVQDSGHRMHDGNSARVVEGMLTSLQSLGYNNLLQGYLESMPWTNDMTSQGFSQTLQHKYELAWKSMQWEAVLPGLSTPCTDEAWRNKTSGENGLVLYKQRTIFESLRAIAHEEFSRFHDVVAHAKTQLLRSIQLSLHSFESSRDLHSALVHLQAIREIEEMATQLENDQRGRTTSRVENDTSVEARDARPLFTKWQDRIAQVANEFDKAESLLSLEEVLLLMSKTSDRTQVLINLYLDLASLSRKAGRTAVAYRALLKLEQLDQRGLVSVHDRMEWQLQQGKLLWQQQERRSAIWTGKKVCSELSTYVHASSLPSDQLIPLQLLLVKGLTLTGKWIASQRSESSEIILTEYFQRATEIMTSIDADAVSTRSRDAARAHFALADFMAAMYQQVHARVHSREWLAGKNVVQARHEELQALLAMEASTQKENRAHIHALNKEVVHDMHERAQVEASVDHFLAGALRSYGKGLCCSRAPELDSIFRVLLLWLNNQSNAEINRVVIEEVIDVVPSFKFVPLSYQIISRISGSTETSSFQVALRKLVLKLCVEHPHHTLVQLLALKNSGDVQGKGALQFRTNGGDAKAEGAKVYLAAIMQTRQRHLLESLELITTAYVHLALFDTREYHGQKRKLALSMVPVFETTLGRSGGIPFDQCLRSHVRRGIAVERPAVFTSTLPAQADMDYSSVVRLHAFEPTFTITDSGIHRPKILYCHGSDGKLYKQLVKGHDDTRQDLVIEQVFETMNHFLRAERATRKRNLHLRTYRVVPLSPMAGVLEWVDHTIPWGAYLVGRTATTLSAHERYHPHEWTHSDCRHYLKNAPDKLRAFLDLQAHFTPVFHHFFLEKFPDPAVWHARRRAYVHSVAVTSIVGYILGIGDRHAHNILIHQETGELVHIDFGVVFDQGMALYTPETVPFRLTRDMVDGMGLSGVDGIFSRCCEVTLQLLRNKRASVVTILEVFVHDPLYRWTLSPLKALKLQEGGRDPKHDGSKAARRARSDVRPASSDHRVMEACTAVQSDAGMTAEPASTDAATRALLRVKQKLDGYEDPNGSALSVEGQVKHLLSAAQDPHNLCRLFPGWAPWL